MTKRVFKSEPEPSSRYFYYVTHSLLDKNGVLIGRGSSKTDTPVDILQHTIFLSFLDIYSEKQKSLPGNEYVDSVIIDNIVRLENPDL